jgi:hypothetical protein
MSQVVVFHGIEHKSGCTMTAQSVAELAAKGKKELTVLFAALNGRASTEFMSEKVASVDEFKIQLKSGIGIDKNTLNPNKKIDNLFFIGGIVKEEEARCFLPGMAEMLAESLFSKFDLIIIDSGCEIDNGLAFGALGLKSMKYLIMEQTESSVKRYEKMREIYKKLGIGFDKYVLSKYIDNDPLSINYVATRLGLEKTLLMTTRYQDRGRISEIEYRSLIETGHEKYRNDILKIVNDVMKEMNSEKISLKRKRPWKSFI